MSLSNKILLHETVLKPILFNGSHVWGSAANSILKIVQTVQNKVLRSTSKSPWYVRNYTIHRNLKVDPIKISIKKILPTSSRIYILFPMRFFIKSPTIRCMAVVRRLDLPYFNLIFSLSPCTSFVVYFAQRFKTF